MVGEGSRLIVTRGSLEGEVALHFMSRGSEIIDSFVIAFLGTSHFRPVS